MCCQGAVLMVACCVICIAVDNVTLSFQTFHKQRNKVREETIKVQE